jgi:AcrR family transcriptional regulator
VARSRKGKVVEPDGSPGVRQRILDEFSARAARSGIRSVVMMELASELRMSATTLYNHFPSKGDLVTAMIERWVADVGSSEVTALERRIAQDPMEGLVGWAEAWSRSTARYAHAFWNDLRRDYPDAWTLFQNEIQRRKAAGAALLGPFLRDDVHPATAMAILDRILALASDPRKCEQLGTSRSEAIRTGIRLWARGALRSRGELSVIPRRGSARSKTRGGPAR